MTVVHVRISIVVAGASIVTWVYEACIHFHWRQNIRLLVRSTHCEIPGSCSPLPKASQL